MRQQSFEKFDKGQITAAKVEDAATLFSQNYGIWSKDSDDIAKHGQPILFSYGRLRRALLPDGSDCSLVQVTVDGTLAGHAIACYWNVPECDMTVGWVTQLVVHRCYRERGLATGLLSMLRRDDVSAWGILSSHPAAIMAAAKAFSDTIDRVDLNYIKRHAAAFMNASPIEYVRTAEPRGSLFGIPSLGSQLNVSCADTDFFVDHLEPRRAWAWAKKEGRWPLGGLAEGHEYLLIVKAKADSPQRELLRAGCP